MKSYYLSEKEYNQVLDLIKSSESQTIRYHGLVIQLYLDLGESEYKDQEYLVCTYEKDILARNYEWYFIPNPADYR